MRLDSSYNHEVSNFRAQYCYQLAKGFHGIVKLILYHISPTKNLLPLTHNLWKYGLMTTVYLIFPCR